MNRTITKILDVLTTILLCILMVSMVCLVVIYLFGFSRTPTYELDANTIRQARESDNKIDLSGYLDYRFVVPGFSAVCSSTGVDYCVLGGNEAQLSIYNQVDEVIYALFNENAEVTFLDRKSGESTWKERLLGDGVFIEWLSYIRKSAIFYNTFPDMLSQNITNEAIKCIMIYPVEDGIEAIAKVGEDGYAVYRPMRGSSVSFDFKKIEMAHPITFKFAAADSTVEDSFDGKINVLPECIIIDEISKTNIDVVSSLNMDNLSIYVNAFRINTVKASSYVDDAKNTVYVDEDTKLVMGEKGVYYTSDSAHGIHISTIIGNSEEYELKDYICVCNKLLADLEIDYLSNDVYIADILYMEDNLTISYGIKHESIPLMVNGVANPIRFTFKDNTLVSASIFDFEISETENQTAIIQYLSIVSYLISDNEGNVDFKLFYYSDNNSEKINWIVQHEEYEIPGEHS
ncbi:MAG: hypothetical protein K6F14_05750 [Clostridiales bacterium]|nr:hypothetical protein [Clostridiales bacterium]